MLVSIPNGILGLLSVAPTHGYQLRTDFEAATGSTWPLNIGQVYSTLQRLERDGLVAADEGDDDERRQYRLTEAGLERLDRWFASPVPREAPPRDELVIKLALAMHLPAVDARRVIDIQRAASMRGLQTLIRARADVGDDLGAALTADSAIFHAEAEIRWLDHCEARLQQPAKGVRG